MTFIVGLTGGIGSGKTTVANLFAKQGIELVDADLIAREIVEPGEPALQQIADHFGEKTLQPDGSLNRAALRQIVFADPSQRLWLEQLTHPLIRQRTLERLQQARSDYAMLVSPLLLETDQHQLVDHILVVDVSEAIQIERTVHRDSNTKHQVREILNAQCNRKQRLERADSVIDNSLTQQALIDQVNRLDQQFRLLAGKPPIQE
ncbi:MAG: dephospho-CoA kinase [Halopseudomonas sp.]